MMTGIEYAKPVVAIENEFLDSLLRLPKKIQKKTREFLDKFRNDPRSPGINLERVKNSQDGKLYSVRIDQQYRAIVAYQKETGVYLLLYVDNHDDAYTWAVNKCVQVNPHTNTIQVYQHMEETEQAEALRHLQEGDAENSGMLSGATAADTSGATQAAMVDGNAALAKASNAAGSTLAHEETDAHRTRTGTIAEPVASTVTSKNAPSSPTMTCSLSVCHPYTFQSCSTSMTGDHFRHGWSACLRTRKSTCSLRRKALPRTIYMSF